MALALTASVSCLMSSPMVLADEDAGDGGGSATVWGGGEAAGGGDEGQDCEDRLERDTRLSSALAPNDTGPQLRNS